VLNDVSEKLAGDTPIAPTSETYLNEWVERVGAYEFKVPPAVITIRVPVDRKA
jgi:hypothetical protein